MDIWRCPVPDPDYAKHQALRVTWFNMIAPKGNWKLPIDCWIYGRYFADCRQACLYFTGSDLKMVGTEGNMIHVEAAGYYATIGV